MNVAALRSTIPGRETEIERIAENPRLSEPEKVAEAARQFEAMLVRQILTDARKTVIRAGEDDQDSATDSIYQDMINTQLADAISRSGTLGLASALAAQLAPRAGASGPADPAPNR